MEVHSGVSRALMLILTTIAFSSLAAAKSRDDIVVLNNGDRMTGEIKSLDHGELKFKSSYMLDSVALDWPKVARLESKDNYIVVLTSGQVLTVRAAINRASIFERPSRERSGERWFKRDAHRCRFLEESP